MPGSVVEAVEHDLAKIAERDPELAESTLAAGALVLATELDARNSLTSKSMAHKELRETMARLRELCPPVKEKDRLDEVAHKRQQRRARAGAGGSDT